MKSLKVALLQLSPTATRQGNLEKGCEACREAKRLGADIALFPEMWSCGYVIDEDGATLNENAIDESGIFIQTFKELAKELKMAIGITLLEKYSPSPRNTLYLYDRFGKQVLVYAKVHTCDFGDEARLTAGDDFYVVDLDTTEGIVKVGAMICYDREFPESARILMLKGAELILVPNACPMEINRLSQLRARAYENMVAIATVNYPAEKEDCNGHSSAFDGVAYRAEDEGSRDTCIIETGTEEGIFIADFSMDDIRDYRRREVHGNAYRQPQKYHSLLSEKIEAPFIRDDYRKQQR